METIADRVVDHAFLRGGEAVLDLGAGTGLLTFRAARQVGPAGKVVALDSDAGCLETVRRRRATLGVQNVSTRPGRMEALPLDAGSFDAVVCRSALTYAVDLRAAISGMGRVLIPAGRFSLFEPLPGEMEWSFARGVDAGRFLEMENALKKGRRNSTLTRDVLRDELSTVFCRLESLPVHYGLSLAGRDEKELADEYLYDLPGELGAFYVLKNVMEDGEIVRLARWFAGAASAGEVRGTLPCLFAWGAKG